MNRSALFFFVTLAAGAGLSPARALESPWVTGAQADTRLLADHAANAPVRAGVEIKLKAGWKTYWRYPGDAGVPPRFDWSGSENLAADDGVVGPKTWRYRRASSSDASPGSTVGAGTVQMAGARAFRR